MRVGRGFHLTYCSNIHPGETWQEVAANLERYVPPIRQRVAGDAPFAIGLRLSDQAARELEEPPALAALQRFLDAQNCYVFTINGFPYGRFHHGVVKERVYLPDWKEQERVEYSNRLARILCALLPAAPAVEGSISTVPGAYRDRVTGPEDAFTMARLMLQHASVLRGLLRETGRTISLALEAEPCCHIETIDEVVDFFRGCLFDAEVLARFNRGRA